MCVLVMLDPAVWPRPERKALYRIAADVAVYVGQRLGARSEDIAELRGAVAGDAVVRHMQGEPAGERPATPKMAEEARLACQDVMLMGGSGPEQAEQMAQVRSPVKRCCCSPPIVSLPCALLLLPTVGRPLACPVPAYLTVCPRPPNGHATALGVHPRWCSSMSSWRPRWPISVQTLRSI